ncbi:hypothetical protein KJ969_04850 [Patescibacteria group bacterium]|nr:hypothetical protein [Patescibacteria group bacterium]MBU1922002.1 hypothetical protein [Patescibacteria group bacterium]
MENLKHNISLVILDMESSGSDKKIFLNIYPKKKKDMPLRELEDLEFSFDYHDMRLNFRVKTAHPGIPIQLELEAFGPFSVEDFESDTRSVCLVKEIVFHCSDQEAFSIRNDRYNPSCLD